MRRKGSVHYWSLVSLRVRWMHGWSHDSKKTMVKGKRGPPRCKRCSFCRIVKVNFAVDCPVKHSLPFFSPVSIFSVSINVSRIPSLSWETLAKNSKETLFSGTGKPLFVNQYVLVMGALCDITKGHDCLPSSFLSKFRDFAISNKKYANHGHQSKALVIFRVKFNHRDPSKWNSCLAKEKKNPDHHPILALGIPAINPFHFPWKEEMKWWRGMRERSEDWNWGRYFGIWSLHEKRQKMRLGHAQCNDKWEFIRCVMFACMFLYWRSERTLFGSHSARPQFETARTRCEIPLVTRKVLQQWKLHPN